MTVAGTPSSAATAVAPTARSAWQAAFICFIGALAATGALAWLVRRQRLAQLFTTAAFILQAAALGNYFAQVEPVNVCFRGLAPARVPSDFLALRARWEYGHALALGLFAAAFILLGCALLMRQAAREPSSGGHPPPEGLSNGDFQDRLSLPTAPKE